MHLLRTKFIESLLGIEKELHSKQHPDSVKLLLKTNPDYLAEYNSVPSQP